jgi:hypothetical protein
MTASNSRIMTLLQATLRRELFSSQSAMRFNPPPAMAMNAASAVSLEHPGLQTETVKLSSHIVEQTNKEAPERHMIVLHGLFGNKSTFRYLANNELVRLHGIDDSLDKKNPLMPSA